MFYILNLIEHSRVVRLDVRASHAVFGEPLQRGKIKNDQLKNIRHTKYLLTPLVKENTMSEFFNTINKMVHRIHPLEMSNKTVSLVRYRGVVWMLLLLYWHITKGRIINGIHSNRQIKLLIQRYVLDV